MRRSIRVSRQRGNDADDDAASIELLRSFISVWNNFIIYLRTSGTRIGSRISDGEYIYIFRTFGELCTGSGRSRRMDRFCELFLARDSKTDSKPSLNSVRGNRYVHSPWERDKETCAVCECVLYLHCIFQEAVWPNPFPRISCSTQNDSMHYLSFFRAACSSDSFQCIHIDWIESAIELVLTWLNAALAAAAWKFFATNPSGVTGRYGAFAVGEL